MTENTIKILNLIHKGSELSRAEISRITGLTRPSVSTIVSDLISLGLISEVCKGKSSGGKPPIFLKFNADNFGAIGIDIGFDSMINGILCNGNSEIIAEDSISFEENTITEISDKLVTLIKTLQSKSAIKAVGVGLGVAGIVDPLLNEVILSSNFDLTQKNIVSIIKARINLPVIIDNRARLAANAELKTGTAIEVNDFIYISIGKSVGAAIVADGKCVYGHSNAAGEIRNFPIYYTNNGELKTAPLEVVASETALLQKAYSRLGRKVSFDELVEEFHSGNEICKELITENAQYIAQISSSLSTIIDSPMILVGGKMKRFGEFYLKELHKNILQTSETKQRIKVEFPKFGELSCCLGAAMTITNRAILMQL